MRMPSTSFKTVFVMFIAHFILNGWAIFLYINLFFSILIKLFSIFLYCILLEFEMDELFDIIEMSIYSFVCTLHRGEELFFLTHSWILCAFLMKITWGDSTRSRSRSRSPTIKTEMFYNRCFALLFKRYSSFLY